jgi:metallophosphoesterase (TIGR03767 family)
MNELERFVALLNGGQTISPDSGSSGYVGVQDLKPSPLFCEFWHPEDTSGATCSGQLASQCGAGCADKWKSSGFPRQYPLMLEQALQPFVASGLDLPWYTAYGNHDELIQGNFAIRPELAPQGALTELAMGDRKLIELPVHGAFPKIKVDEFMAELLNPVDSSSDWRRIQGLWRGPDARNVPSDAARRLWSRREFVGTLVDNPGPYGPPGHGFGAVEPSGEQLYYAFDVTPEIRGVVLDTTNPNGLSGGSLDAQQLAWLETELQAVSSTYRSNHGREIQQPEIEDRLVILFSHHNSNTLDNLLPSLDPLRLRVGAKHLLRLLLRYPNVVLWLNGHTHFAKILAHPNERLVESGLPGSGFWEVNTPSLIDFPQTTRTIELRRNLDGTLSIFTTLIDHAAPVSASETEDPVLRLAAISRELAANDPLLHLAIQVGDPGDRNTELLVRMPFEMP